MDFFRELVYGLVFFRGVFTFLGLLLFPLLRLQNLRLDFLHCLKRLGRFLVLHLVNVVLYLELSFDKLVDGFIILAFIDLIHDFLEFPFLFLYGLLHYIGVFLGQVAFQLVDVFTDFNDFLIYFFLDLGQTFLLGNIDFLLKILRRCRLFRLGFVVYIFLFKVLLYRLWFVVEVFLPGVS